MKSNKPITAFAPHEVNRFLAPLVLAAIFFIALIICFGLLIKPNPNIAMIIYGVMGTLYLLINNALIARSAFILKTHGWLHSITSGIGVGILAYILPIQFGALLLILIVFGAIGTATILGRYHTYINLLIIIVVSLPKFLMGLISINSVLEYIAPFVISITIAETYLRIKDTAQQHIRRLETVNKVSHKLMQSLDTDQVISLLNPTILDTIEADTYFIGMLKGDEVQLDLFYDEGEFFNGMHVPVEGTLASWVINNQKALFLPDLRDDVQLEGVKVKIVGKEKTSLS
ncbi:MAG: hypothetical protein ABI986_03685, partial [Chloroflexota bacterium]